MEHKPPSSCCNSGNAHIDPNGEIAEEEPATDECFPGKTRGLIHDIDIRGVEPKSSGRQSICDQIDPEQLDRDKSLRKTQSSSKENARERKKVEN